MYQGCNYELTNQEIKFGKLGKAKWITYRIEYFTGGGYIVIKVDDNKVITGFDISEECILKVEDLRNIAGVIDKILGQYSEVKEVAEKAFKKEVK